MLLNSKEELKLHFPIFSAEIGAAYEAQCISNGLSVFSELLGVFFQILLAVLHPSVDSLFVHFSLFRIQSKKKYPIHQMSESAFLQGRQSGLWRKERKICLKPFILSYTEP